MTHHMNVVVLGPGGNNVDNIGTANTINNQWGNPLSQIKRSINNLADVFFPQSDDE